MVPDPNSQCATWLAGADGAVDLRETVVAASLPCLDCGYDLRGAPATGNCAECGASITEALSHAIDPLAHSLPSLADPRAVGNGLVAAVGAMTAAVALPFVGFLISALIELAWQSVPINPTGPMKLAALGGAVVVLLLGCRACWALRPREGGPLQHDARRAVAWLGVALAVLAAGQVLLWAALSVPDPALLIMGVECILAGLLLSMLGLRRVLVEAGQRSRHFRTAKLGKQRIGPVLTANVVSMALFAGYWIAMGKDGFGSGFGLGVLWLVVTGMLIVGLGYMLVNAWWIRRDLHQPPPKLSELVD